MNKKPRIETVHRVREPKAAKSKPPSTELTTAQVGHELLYGASGLPAWQDNDAVDPARVYAHAVKELALLGRLAPDLNIKLAANQFLVNEFRPAAQESEEVRERRLAFSQIDQILRAKGIAPPEEPPLEMELVGETEGREEFADEEQTDKSESAEDKD
jgi:hypothetical protein